MDYGPTNLLAKLGKESTRLDDPRSKPSSDCTTAQQNSSIIMQKPSWGYESAVFPTQDTKTASPSGEASSIKPGPVECLCHSGL